jgi:hypothetical protein
MADEKSRKSKSIGGESTKLKAVAKASGSPLSVERPFDMWLQKQLHAMYDEITAEPLPSDLLNLIDKDSGKPPKQ